MPIRPAERLLALLRRWSRKGEVAAAFKPARRRLLILQIDGLSSARLERAIADGEMPELAARLRERRLVLERLRTFTTPSTPVYQAALLYGTTCGIPGFGWHDRRLGRTVRMDLAEDVEAMEHELEQNGGTPLLDGGASYGTIFDGRAAEAFFNVVHWGKEGRISPATTARRNAWDAAATALLGAITVSRGTARLVAEAGVGVWDLLRFIRRERTTRFEWRFLYMRVFSSVILRDVATHGLILDVLRGVPILFMDYLAYDEYAHRRGPDSRFALYNLRGIDAAIGSVLRAVDSVPEHRYDVFVLSDHGQSATVPFVRVVGEDPAEFVVRHALSDHAHASALLGAAVRDLVKVRTMQAWARAQRRPIRALVDPLLARWHARSRAALSACLRDPTLGDVELVTGGTIAHVYLSRREPPLDLPTIERRFPRLVAALTDCDGVGLMVARAGRRRGGAVVFYRGRRYRIDDRAALARLAPFQVLGVDLLAHHLEAQVASPRSGDLVLFGAFAPGGNVAFDFEFGSHGGVHPEELDCFLMHPPGVDPPAHGDVRADELYRFFRARYAAPERPAAA